MGFAIARNPIPRSLIGLAFPDASYQGSAKALAIASQWNDIGLTWFVQQRIARGEGVSSDHQLLSTLNQVRDALESKSIPDATFVGATVQAARTSLADWVSNVYHAQSQIWDAAQLGQLVAHAASQGESYGTWEATTQLYLAAVASRVAWPSGPAGPVNSVASQLQVGLRYPDRLATPQFARSDLGPTLRREEAANLAVELASWLGSATPPNLEPWSSQASDLEPERQKLQAVIDRVNKALAEARKTQAKKAEEETDKTKTDPTDSEKTERPPVKTREQLLEELRQRRSNNQGNPFGDD